jgi:hypothetical protein
MARGKTRMRARAEFAIVTLALSTSLVTVPAVGSEVHFGTSDIPTVFYISKSDDHNRVDYGMRLNSSCAPANNDAVFPYWRQFEHSPPVRTEPLGPFEYFGYGISEQRLVHAGKPDAAYLVRLKQFKQRPVWITTKRDDSGHCQVLARCAIGKVRFAQLSSIYVKLAGLLSVEYIILKGRNPATDQLVEERINK